MAKSQTDETLKHEIATPDQEAPLNLPEVPNEDPNSSLSEAQTVQIASVGNSFELTDKNLPPPRENQPNQAGFYYYPVNEYIAVDRNMDLNVNVVRQEEEATAAAATASNTQVYPVITEANVEEHVTYEELNNSLAFKCVKCKNFADSSLITYETYKHHLINCDPNCKIICGICLCLFDKNAQNELMEHVNIHINSNENDNEDRSLNSISTEQRI
jgi:hypothetical protein